MQDVELQKHKNPAHGKLQHLHDKWQYSDTKYCQSLLEYL